MLKSIEITNLQNHRHTRLDLVPGVNVIVGPSRSGKTALFRGLRKLVENRPVQGLESWVHKHDKKAQIKVEIVTTDGCNVSWSGPQDQKYMLDGEEFRGFGQSVPEPVALALNLGDINLGQQFDQPFLLFDSPGQVARYLNQVVNLDVIDRTLANAAADKRRNDRDIGAAQARSVELREQEAAFPDLDVVEDFVSGLEQKEARLGEAAAALSAAKSIQVSLASLRERLAQVRVPEHVAALVDGLAEKQVRLERLTYTRDMLRDIQLSLAGLVGQRRELALFLEIRPLVERLDEASRLLAAKKRHMDLAVKIIGAIADARKRLLEKKAIIKEKQAEYDRLMPDRCPLCGK